MLTRFGGPEVLRFERAGALPEPGSGEVRVRTLVTSAAFTDVMIRKGMYPELRRKPPFVPGYDMVGIVDAFGPGVAGLAEGGRVAALTVTGAYAEYVCRPAENWCPCPTASPTPRRWRCFSRASRLGRCCTGSPASTPARAC
jgi:NADPH:quinone reductase-like Zn-dependent oxidoreductase